MLDKQRKESKNGSGGVGCWVVMQIGDGLGWVGGKRRKCGEGGQQNGKKWGGEADTGWGKRMVGRSDDVRRLYACVT